MKILFLVAFVVSTFACTSTLYAKGGKGSSAKATATRAVTPKAPTGTGAKSTSTNVRAHVTKNNVYVPPHRRSTPDTNKANNWSAKGNTNPYTGKKGTK